MNGIHDMGGLHGFGKVEVEPEEPVFHSRWEGRVFAIAQSLGGNLDAGRHSLERLDPVAYLKDGYYGRWLAALERTLSEFGVLQPEEIDARMQRGTAATHEHPRTPSEPWLPTGGNYARQVDTPPAFARGQVVLTRNHQPPGHTRLPAYTRHCRGVVVRVHPAMVFPDDHAHGRGENPQVLYTVRFAGKELWGADAEPGSFVHIDLFESYLEPAPAG